MALTKLKPKTLAFAVCSRVFESPVPATARGTGLKSDTTRTILARTGITCQRQTGQRLEFCSLFAGKLHAVLCRGWKNRIKGRDFYDFVWYVGRKITPNLRHLEARMRQSGHWSGESITSETLTGLLKKRFAEVNFPEAAAEVRVFLHDAREVELWSKDFFVDLATRIPTVPN